MRRKSIAEVTKHMHRVSDNLEDRDTIIKLLLKRMCTYDEAMDYLLSAVINQTKDDIMGELVSWEFNKPRQ